MTRCGVCTQHTESDPHDEDCPVAEGAAWKAEGKLYRRMLLNLCDHLNGDDAEALADFLYPGEHTDREAIIQRFHVEEKAS